MDYSKILNEKSREYFLEAVNCFENRCYRAAMSTLYCVCLCDIFYKLIEIRDEYGFAAADEILKEIKSMQNDDHKKEAWESNLIKLVRTRTALLDDLTHKMLLQIRDWRHISAHPALDDNNELINAKPEMVSAYLQEAYERLLTQHPIYVKSRDLSKTISDDLLNRRDELKDPKVFVDFLEREYGLSHLEEDVIISLFKSFWRFELTYIDSWEAEMSRDINARLMIYLYQCYDKLLDEYFSKPQNHLRMNRELWEEAHRLFVECPSMFGYLYDEDKIMMEQKIDKPYNLDKFIMSWYFCGGDKIAHVEKLKRRNCVFQWESSHRFFEFREQYKQDGLVNVCDNYIISKFNGVRDFIETGQFFFHLMQSTVQDWDKDNCELFFKVANSNNQIYCYDRFKNEILPMVMEKAIQYFSKKELIGNYPNLKEAIEKIN